MLPSISNHVRHIRSAVWFAPAALSSSCIVTSGRGGSRYSSRLLFGRPSSACNSGKLRSYESSALNHETANSTTIYALSTAPGRAAIAIIRISGPACIEIYRKICPGRKLPKPRLATFRALHDPGPSSSQAPGHVLDSGALVLYFPGPTTVTGEDVLELHVHGGPAIVRAVLSAIPKCAGSSLIIRYADPGEFTRRAFMNNRIDLTQAEALGASLSAVTEEQRRLSVQGANSGLAQRYETWRQSLLYARGELEALIDFSEDQYFEESPLDMASSVAHKVDHLLRSLKLYSANAVRGELLRNGIAISLIGSPNVGKSSLLNQIVGRDASIVSNEAGTTRDVVEVGVDIGGFFCRLGDTAGLRGEKPAQAAVSDIIGEVEKEGIARAKAKALASDVVILLLSIEPSPQNDGHELRVEKEVIATGRALLAQGKRILVGVNKMDSLGQNALSIQHSINATVMQYLPGIARDDIFCVSCKLAEQVKSPGPLMERDSLDPSKLQEFLDGLVRVFRSMTTASTPDWTNTGTEDTVWEESLGATERQRLLLEQCADHLQAFLDVVRLPAPSVHQSDDALEDIDIVVATEYLRQAAVCLSKVTGRGTEAGDVEEVLGVVFEKCGSAPGCWIIDVAPTDNLLPHALEISATYSWTERGREVLRTGHESQIVPYSIAIRRLTTNVHCTYCAAKQAMLSPLLESLLLEGSHFLTHGFNLEMDDALTKMSEVQIFHPFARVRDAASKSNTMAPAWPASAAGAVSVVTVPAHGDGAIVAIAPVVHSCNPTAIGVWCLPLHFRSGQTCWYLGDCVHSCRGQRRPRHGRLARRQRCADHDEWLDGVQSWRNGLQQHSWSAGRRGVGGSEGGNEEVFAESLSEISWEWDIRNSERKRQKLQQRKGGKYLYQWTQRDGSAQISTSQFQRQGEAKVSKPSIDVVRDIGCCDSEMGHWSLPLAGGPGRGSLESSAHTGTEANNGPQLLGGVMRHGCKTGREAMLRAQPQRCLHGFGPNWVTAGRIRAKQITVELPSARVALVSTVAPLLHPAGSRRARSRGPGAHADACRTFGWGADILGPTGPALGVGRSNLGHDCSMPLTNAPLPGEHGTPVW
ncbi:hypothetical protein FH972_021460 [Carpinus fangiana]|uniref:TrmE-type G domain-containing protein n=1 Tax=Carpinus fangiana TaxID=176857 RepID=A0A5N6KPR4_9ROSI|nr:hypothetical protein FH972_021460 [Carpinus fangiana]